MNESANESSLLQETRLLSDKILETQQVLKTVMMRVSTLEKNVERLREENLSEKLKNKHLNSELARERKQSQQRQQQQQQQQQQQKINDQNTNDDGEMDDVKTLVMRRAAASNGATTTTTTTTTTPVAVPPNLNNQHQNSKIVTQTPTAPILTTTATTNIPTPAPHLTSAHVPKIAKKKERVYAPNDPRRDAFAGRVPAQTITNRVPAIDTSVDASTKEKKRQLKKEISEREREEHATKKVKTCDDDDGNDDDAMAEKFKKKPTKKEKKKHKEEERTTVDVVKLSEQEEHHLKYGHGKRGVRVDTVQGPAYFSLDDEQLLGIGDKVNVHPLTLYSLFRWGQSPDLSLRSRLHQGTRLFLVPSEEWEFEYIREDELKAITKICEKISKASAELCFDDADLRTLKNKVQELSKNTDKKSATYYFVSLPFYRAVKDIMKNQSATKDHLERAEKKFAHLWQAAGFLEPERNAATVRSFQEQKEALRVLFEWKDEHGV